MLSWNTIIDARHRREMLSRESEAAQIAASLKSPSARYSPLRPMIAWAGRRLVSLGFALLVHAREWEYRSNTVYNGAKSSAHIS